MKILAIDDIIENLILLKEIILLSFPKAKLLTATSGMTGIEICKNEMPDIIILDVMMPVMDGFEVCRILKANKNLKHIPVLIMTAAHTEKAIRINALDSGADAFLAKPLDESELTAQIRSMMRIKLSEDRKKTEKQRLEMQVQKRTEALIKELAERKIAEAKLKLSNERFEKSQKTTLSLMQKLRIEIKERLSAEQKVKEHLNEQIIISEVTRNLVSLHKLDDVYSYIGEKIYEIASNTYVIVTTYNQSDGSMQKKYQYGFNDKVNELNKLFKTNPFSSEILKSDITPEELNNLKKRELFELPEGKNYLLFDRTFNFKIWPRVSDILQVKSVFTMGFTWEDRLFGGISILVKENLTFELNKLIETLVNQASVVIQRLFTEEKLEQNEKLYRSLVETSPDGISMWDLNGNIIALNQEMLRLFGYKDENEIRSSGKKVFDLICDSDRRRAIEDFSGKHSGAKLSNQEYNALHVDGNTFSIEINSSLISDIHDQPYGFISIIRDISSRKQVENALRENRELYKLLADKMTDVVWLKDLYGRSIFVSPSITKFTGFSVEEYLNQTIEDRFVAESAVYGKKIFSKELKRYSTQKQLPDDYIISLQLEYICKYGGTKWGELVITPFYNDNNELQGIHGVTRDIDERKLVEISLLESEEKYRLLTNNMVDILSLFDTSGRILYINNSVQTHLGYDPVSLIGKFANNLFFKSDYQKIRNFLKKGDYASISNIGHTCRIITKDGGFIWFETNVLPLKNKEGIVDRFQCVSRNITDKIENELKLEEERQNVLTALIDGQEIERQRISMELHDGLGQRLAGIKMKLENSGSMDLDKTRQTVNEVKTDFWNMIDEIRMISNNVSPAILSQWGLVPSLSELCKQFKNNSGISYDITVMGQFDKISEKMVFYIYRIVQEGLTNVAKHSEAKIVKLALIEKENYLLILIEDDGKGITFEKNALIRGNGLKNMKQRALLLKGDLNIESEKGSGTIICVRIPK
ncbi:MAG: PAS domain S-box protein [Bacteroidota bacterium]